MNTQAQAAKEFVGFDLDNLGLAAEVTHKVGVIFDDAGDAVSGFIMVGKNSEQYRSNQKAQRIENIQRAANRRVAIDTKTEGGATLVADTVDTNDLRTAQAVVVGIFGFSKGGQPAAYTKDLADRMLEAMPAWRDMVLRDLDVDANFMPGSSNG